MITLDRLSRVSRLHRALWGAAPLALAAVLAAGCGSAGSTASTQAKSGSASTSGSAAGGSADMSGMSGMSGMDMGTAPAATSSAAASAEASAAGDVTPVPTQVLGTAVWQGMKITADAMTPVPFDIYNGTSMQEVKPQKNTSFHLMVTLNDAQTNVVIPYASVWATIAQGSKTTYDESLWPMISRYMGPHYGNDVALPGSGTYKLTLLVSPPVSARHVEYQGVWVKPHKVMFTFNWHQAA
jgi:uncharacterized protein involved in high-affinity Fe2+ transport